MGDYFGKDTFKLGFGMMRLPHLPDGENDQAQINEMADIFISGGGTYVDTAFVYDGGKSEEAVRKAFVERYPRDSFTIATKLNARVAKDEEDAKAQLATSLKRLGTDYLDFYLLHAVSDDNYQQYCDYHLWDFIKQKKEEGVLRNIGFSYHGTPECLDRILTEHKVDFMQLQINYADMDAPNVQSRRCWETARKHGVSVTVMEPVKGGALANPHESITKIFKEYNPSASMASWAIRYVASMDGIITVLSGMSNLEQMMDNMSYMREFRPLDEQEQAVVKAAQDAMKSVPSIACTACHYCTEGCPMSIPIPEIFAAMNRNIMFNMIDKAQRDYARATEGKGKASECLQCGQCEGACPQHLPIIELLQDCASALEV